MRASELHADPAPIRPGVADRLLGALGAAVIGLTLFSVRVWARVTRTPYIDG